MEVDLAQSQDFEIGDSVLPSGTQDWTECSNMALLQLLDVMAVESQGLTALEQWCEDNSSVDFQLCS